MLPPQAIALTIVSSIFPAFSIFAVGLRIHARRLKGNPLSWSDYMIFFTLLNAILNAIACIIGAVACGIGLPLSALTPEYKERFMKILFVTQFFYVFSVWSVKASVLFFYRTVFPTKGFLRVVLGTQLALVAWIIAFFFVTLFQDKPIARNWGAPGTTINWRTFYIVEIATDVALDVFILCLPLPVIHRLSISNKKKWLISGVFWLGAVIVIASTVRLYYMIKVKQEFQNNDDDFSFTTINTIIWGSIEPCMSVIAACLPILGPVFFKNKRRHISKPNKSSVFASYLRRASGKSSRPPGGNYSHAINSIDRLKTMDTMDTTGTQSKSISTNSLVAHETDINKYDMPAIYVQRGQSVDDITKQSN